MACAMIEIVANKLQDPGFLEKCAGARRTDSQHLPSRAGSGDPRSRAHAGFGLQQVRQGCFGRPCVKGASLRVGPADSKVVRLTPPLILGEEHVQALAQALGLHPCGKRCKSFLALRIWTTPPSHACWLWRTNSSRIRCATPWPAACWG